MFKIVYEEQRSHNFQAQNKNVYKSNVFRFCRNLSQPLFSKIPIKIVPSFPFFSVNIKICDQRFQILFHHVKKR